VTTNAGGVASGGTVDVVAVVVVMLEVDVVVVVVATGEVVVDAGRMVACGSVVAGDAGSVDSEGVGSGSLHAKPTMTITSRRVANLRIAPPPHQCLSLRPKGTETESPNP
jgi:hypothetical protein